MKWEPQHKISYTTGREYRRERNPYLTSEISFFTRSRHNCLVIFKSSAIECDVNREGQTQGRCVKIVVLSSFMDSSCRVRNKVMYVLSVHALTRVLIWCLFPPLCATLEINTKITLPWAHKLLATRVHTLYIILYIYIIYHIIYIYSHEHAFELSVILFMHQCQVNTGCILCIPVFPIDPVAGMYKATDIYVSCSWQRRSTTRLNH